LRFLRHGVVQRRDLEATAIGDSGIRQCVHSGQVFHCRQFLFQHAKARFKEALTVDVHGQARLSLIT
jgi:hypothetical protein